MHNMSNRIQPVLDREDPHRAAGNIFLSLTEVSSRTERVDRDL